MGLLSAPHTPSVSPVWSSRPCWCEPLRCVLSAVTFHVKQHNMVLCTRCVASVSLLACRAASPIWVAWVLSRCGPLRALANCSDIVSFAVCVAINANTFTMKKDGPKPLQLNVHRQQLCLLLAVVVAVVGALCGTILLLLLQVRYRQSVEVMPLRTLERTPDDWTVATLHALRKPASGEWQYVPFRSQDDVKVGRARPP